MRCKRWLDHLSSDNDIWLPTRKTHGCVHVHDTRHRLPTDCRLGLSEQADVIR